MTAATATLRHHRVKGLQSAAEIVVDPWGIAHLRADSRQDAFFVQGFNAARDRLWQLDLWRKRGLGLLAADFGPGYLAQDRASRLFLYRGDMASEWAAYGTTETQSICTAFVTGINAFIALTEAKPELLPPEFSELGTRPAPWQAEDVVRIRSNALVRNLLSEVARAQVTARAGLATDLARRSLEPAWTPIVPDGIDLAAIPPDVLDVFKLATAQVTFSPERLAAPLDHAGRWIKTTDLGEIFVDPDQQGSNNWAVSGGRTATGRPILASDPHRTHGLPSLRYIVHLTAPGLDVIGAGEPALPGISIGHNGTAAFSLTIFPVDQEDLYVYETDPADPNRYRYGDGWEAMRTVDEGIVVKGAPDQNVTLKFTRHGPVIFEDAARNRAYAVRSVWFEPGSAAYLASLAYLDAMTRTDFEVAVSHWSVPSVNHVYADTAGSIAWIAAGKTPRRTSFDGLLPVPGDGRHEWQGYLSPRDLPREIDPARGFVASANEMNLPHDFPIDDRRVGFEWAERSRATRIHEVLEEQTRHDLAQSMALQVDDLSIPARRLIVLLPAATSDDSPDFAAARGRLVAWDHRLARDSAPAALFEVWWTTVLKPALLERLAPDPALRALLAPGDVETLLAGLETEAPGTRDALLRRTLEMAMTRCRALLGEDADGWAWGRLHHGYFPHPLSSLRASGTPPDRDVGPLPKGGSGSTPMNATYRPQDFRVVSGSSFRMVVDVGDWDLSRTINAPGQSGDPRSAHYADLAPLWAAGEYVPLLYSRAAIDAVATLRITLTPD